MYDRQSARDDQRSGSVANSEDEERSAGREQVSLGFAQDDARGMATEEAASEEGPWVPGTTKTTTDLTGTYGTYKVEHGFDVDADGDVSYEYKITMTANDKAKGESIGWVQTVRRSKGSGGSGWATKKTDQGMTDERAKRTDDKTGWRVDRASAPAKKTPFYGMAKKSGGGIEPDSSLNNTKPGKHGGDNPMMYDKPGLYAKDQLEFISTATDIATGVQYDAIVWGCTYDKAGKVATGITPTIVKAGDERIAGRDRAINKWNAEIAGGDIDKVPTTVDPAAIAKVAFGAMDGLGTNEKALREALVPITDPDVRARVKACYRIESGRDLAGDLRDDLSDADLKEFAAWL